MPTAAQRPPANIPQAAPTDGAPTKGDLTTWWRQFKKGGKKPKEEEQAQVTIPTVGIFGVPLDVSIKYANVAISQIDDNGQSYLYGYVPIIVAKCGVFLKEKAMDVEGIFRLAGAERRIKELMTVFNSPDRYGRGLDWTGYTVHDAANLLRRYLNQLPEPIIPLAMYPKFREPLRNHQAQAVGPMDQQLETLGDFDPDATILIFQQLITELPPLNRQLLLYILDLLAVFASKCEVNLMTAPNLSAIFQPGILRHPSHDLVPSEYRLSQDVVIFLIEHQDHFVIGLAGTAADEQTIQDVQTAPKPSTPTTPKGRTQHLLGRSASTASAGSESARKFGNVQRHASTNSRGSRQSQHTPSPITPPAGSPYLPGSKGSGMHRSNTVPTKKSPPPALSGSERFSRFQAAEPIPASNLSTPNARSPTAALGTHPVASISQEHLGIDSRPSPDIRNTPSPHRSPLLRPFAHTRGRSPNAQWSVGDTSEGMSSSGRASPAGTPSRERLSSLWKHSPSSDVGRDGRPRNRLQKKRPPGEITTEDAEQSTATGESTLVSPVSPAFASAHLPGQMAGLSEEAHPDASRRPGISTVNSFQTAREQPGSPSQSQGAPTLVRDASEATLKPLPGMPRNQAERHSVEVTKNSPPESTTSQSGAEGSSLSTGEEGDGLEVAHKEKKHHRWRISMSTKKADEKNAGPSTPTKPALGSSRDAERSTSSVNSNGVTRQSYTGDPSQSISTKGFRAPSSSEGCDDRATSPRRAGPIGWFRGKMQERQGRRDEKERAKSPSPRVAATDPALSSQSLGAIASDGTASARPQPQQLLTPSIVQVPTQELQDLSVTPTSQAGNVHTLPTHITTEGLAPAADVGDSSEVMTPRAPDQPNSTIVEPQTALTPEVGEVQDGQKLGK